MFCTTVVISECFFSNAFTKLFFDGKTGDAVTSTTITSPVAYPSADQHMAQQTVTRVLVVGADAKGRQHIPDIADDGSGRPILNQTVLDIYNTVGSLPVSPADNVPVFLLSEHRLHLVAIIVRDTPFPGSAPLCRRASSIFLLFSASPEAAARKVRRYTRIPRRIFGKGGR